MIVAAKSISIDLIFSLLRKIAAQQNGIMIDIRRSQMSERSNSMTIVKCATIKEIKQISMVSVRSNCLKIQCT